VLAALFPSAASADGVTQRAAATPPEPAILLAA